MKIRKATLFDKNYFVNANNSINKITDGKISDYLTENYENDYNDESKQKFYVIEQDKCIIAIFIYSSTYWATHGEGIYVLNIFVSEQQRGKGIIKKILNFIEKNNKNAKFICMYTGKNNLVIQKALVKLGYEKEKMYIYSKPKNSYITVFYFSNTSLKVSLFDFFNIPPTILVEILGINL